MKNRFPPIYSVVLLLACSSSGLSAQDLEPVRFTDLSTIQADVPAVPAAADIKVAAARPSPKQWTVMVYMNGKNNVEPFALRDMNRLETVGSDDKVNVVVELGRTGDPNAEGDGKWSGARRYLVAKDPDTSKIGSPVVVDIPKLDMGDWREAARFVRWAKARYPARRYMLIIWDHGWGWIDPKKSKQGSWRAKSISHDFDTGNYIKTEELPDIFMDAGKVDVYASMACFMQMAEVAWGLKDHADVIVGSEEVIQLPAFNFEAFLSALQRQPGAGAEQAGVFLVDTFKDLYSRPDIADGLAKAKYGVQLSAIRSRELSGLVQRLDQWTAAVRAADDRKAILAAKAGVLRMEIGDETTDPAKTISFYGDLYDFVELVGLHASGPGAAEIRRKGAEVMRFIADRLVIRDAFLGKDRTGKEYSKAHGLSIQIPGAPGTLIEYENKYSDLPFAKASSWAGFLSYLDSVAR